MAHIKFLNQITEYIERDNINIGNYTYYDLNNGNRIKLYCEDNGVNIKVINKTDGEVDRVFLPFENYFKPTQCSPGAPKWTPHIENGKWYFSDTYSHVLPKENDYMNLAATIDQYIILFE